VTASVVSDDMIAPTRVTTLRSTLCNTSAHRQTAEDADPNVEFVPRGKSAFGPGSLLSCVCSHDVLEVGVIQSLDIAAPDEVLGDSSPRKPFNSDLPMVSPTSRTWLAVRALFGLTGQIVVSRTKSLRFPQFAWGIRYLFESGS